MGVPENLDGLRFSCECVSARNENYSDPWAGVAKNRLIVDGTKEEILNLVAQEPKTISQLAKKLNLAPPSVHKHINEMLASELLRDSEECEKLHPKERYYEPNFPVVGADDRAEFEKICQEMSEQVALIFDTARTQFEQAFDKTSMTEKGWAFADVTQYLYARIQRGARKLLEERGTLSLAGKHRNGIDWVFWAEKSSGDTNEEQ